MILYFNILENKFQCPMLHQPQCGLNEVLCPGRKDSNGCETKGMCTPSSKLDHYGFPCPAVCEQHCLSNEKFCEGEKDGRGCFTQGTCEKSYLKNRILCPPLCEVKCSKMQIQCPGVVDKNGCSSEDYCIPNGTYQENSELQLSNI